MKYVNYKKLFTEENVAKALHRTLDCMKYRKLKITTFEELNNSDIVKHHRNADNFFKDVAFFVVNPPEYHDCHRNTYSKYATLCYHLYNNKRQKIRDEFEGQYSLFDYYFSIESAISG